jgi:hypothetical protein
VTTNATILALGFAIGGLVGGPMGAAIGGGIATSFGILAETELKKNIQDVALLARFEEATIGRYVYETLQNSLTRGAGVKFSQWVKKIPTKHFSNFLKKGFEKAGKKMIKEATSKSIEKCVITSIVFKMIFIYFCFCRIRDALVGDELPQEWVNTENEVKRLR